MPSCPHLTSIAVAFVLLLCPPSSRGQIVDGKLQPDILSFGQVYVGATAEGSVRVFLDGDDTSGLSMSVKAPEFVRIDHISFSTQKFANNEKICCDIEASIRTDNAGDLGGFIALKVGDRQIKIPVTAVVLTEDADAPKILVAETPFQKYSTVDSSIFDPWLDLVRDGNFDVHYLSVVGRRPVLRDLDLSSFDVIMLGESGIIGLNDRDFKRIDDYLNSGGRVIVFANAFFRGTVDQANKLLQQYGLQMKDEETGREQRLRQDQILADDLTTNVEEINVFRASPVEVTDEEAARILVKFSPDNKAGVVGVARKGQGEVIAVGQSLWWNWLYRHPESDNSMLLRNLLSKKRR